MVLCEFWRINGIKNQREDPYKIYNIKFVQRDSKNKITGPSEGLKIRVCQ